MLRVFASSGCIVFGSCLEQRYRLPFTAVREKESTRKRLLSVHSRDFRRLITEIHVKVCSSLKSIYFPFCSTLMNLLPHPCIIMTNPCINSTYNSVNHSEDRFNRDKAIIGWTGNMGDDHHIDNLSKFFPSVYEQYIMSEGIHCRKDRQYNNLLITGSRGSGKTYQCLITAAYLRLCMNVATVYLDCKMLQSSSVSDTCTKFTGIFRQAISAKLSLVILNDLDVLLPTLGLTMTKTRDSPSVSSLPNGILVKLHPWNKWSCQPNRSMAMFPNRIQ